MLDGSPRALPKRQRLATTASAEASPQQTAAAPAAQEPQASGSGGNGGSPPPGQQRKPKQIVMPTPVPPPAVPEDPAAWDNAVLLVDKPQTWTSFVVCGKLRHALAALLRRKNREVKVGHAGGAARAQAAAAAAAVRCGAVWRSMPPHPTTLHGVPCRPPFSPHVCSGTLDPMATGLLIVCVGRGTKAVDAFMAMTKEYSGSMRLGEATPSYDADTPVAERAPWEHITGGRRGGGRKGGRAGQGTDGWGGVGLTLGGVRRT